MGVERERERETLEGPDGNGDEWRVEDEEDEGSSGTGVAKVLLPLFPLDTHTHVSQKSSLPQNQIYCPGFPFFFFS